MVAATVHWWIFLACCLILHTQALVDTTPLGCYFHGWTISDELPDEPKNPVNATSALHCQNICGSTTGCESFGYQPTSQNCYLGGKIRMPEKASESFVSGPAQCTVSGQFPSGMQSSSMCAGNPLSSFPGADAEASAAAWTTGVVPVELQCWPHWPETGKAANCEGEPIITLEDTATGWPGKCLGLVETDLPSANCETDCRANVTCSSWQTIEDSNGVLQCWQGVGYDCFSKLRSVNVVKAQRYMRGTYRVLKDLIGYEVTGLCYAFGSSVFGSNLTEAIAACNHTCLSDLYCQAWTYSTGDGCWFDNPANGAMAYPPTSNSFNQNTQAAPLVVAGEYIQRLCTTAQDFTVPTTTGIPTVPLIIVPPLIVDATTSLASTSETVAVTLPPTSTPAAIAASHFVKVIGSGVLYYVDPVAGSLHELRAGCSGWACPEEGVTDCESAVMVAEAFTQDHTVGQDFVCAMMDSTGAVSSTSSQQAAPFTYDESESSDSSMSPWVVLLIVLLLLCCCCASCNYAAWYYYVPIVRRFPWLDGYLPFQWSFGARSSFTKLNEGLGSRSTDLSYDEEFPLMYQAGQAAFANPGFPQQQHQQYQMGMQQPMQQPYQQHQGMYGPGGSPGGMQVDPGYDLVTVTPSGLQVTPLGQAPVPAGVPIVNPTGNSFGSYR